MHWLKRAWRGEERLWKVFWIYAVLAGGVIDVVQQRLLDWILPHIHLLPLQIPDWVCGVMIPWIVFVIVYTVWISGALWKCTFNTRWRILGYAARIAFVFGLLDFSGDIGGFSKDAGSGNADLIAILSSLNSAKDALSGK